MAENNDDICKSKEFLLQRVSDKMDEMSGIPSLEHHFQLIDCTTVHLKYVFMLNVNCVLY